MFATFYKLTGRPFQLSPDHRFFYGSRSHQKAMSYLDYGLHQGEGFIVITGDVGAGKTTLVGHLLDGLDPDRFVAGKVVTTQLDAEDTLRMVATAFGLAQQGQDKATLLRRFEAFLSDQHRLQKHVVLLIDEAQNLPARSLEELRMLSNFQIGEQAPMQVILLGQPQFRNTLADPSLEQLRQRVIASHHLAPMAVDETRQYIEHRLGLVDWQNDPQITDEAFVQIHAAAGGVPRRINNLCTRILLFGALEELHVIDGDVVDEVVNDLQEESAQSTHSRTNGAAGAASMLPPLPWQQNTASHGSQLSNDNLSEEVARLSERLSALETALIKQNQTMRRVLEMVALILEQTYRPKDADEEPELRNNRL